MKTKSTKDPVAALADLLACSHDWNILDIEREFLKIVRASQIKIRRTFVKKILQNFDELEIETKFSPDFDHYSFVKSIISDQNI